MRAKYVFSEAATGLWRNVTMTSCQGSAAMCASEMRISQSSRSHEPSCRLSAVSRNTGRRSAQSR